jgi:hypothetical protein
LPPPIAIAKLPAALGARTVRTVDGGMSRATVCLRQAAGVGWFLPRIFLQMWAERLWRRRLDQEATDLQLYGCLHGGFLGPSGQDHHRDVAHLLLRMLTQLSDKLQPVHARHRDVAQHEVRFEFVGPVEGHVAIIRLGNDEAVDRGQDQLERVANKPVVVDDQTFPACEVVHAASPTYPERSVGRTR